MDIDTDLPKHVAITMDGNGRWAKQRGLERIKGHKEGAKTVKNIVTFSREIGIKYLTLYAFSHENWKRPKTEVTGLFKLLEEYCKSELPVMIENQISFKVIGEWSKLPLTTRKVVKEAIRATENFDAMVLTLALSYSSRREILNAVNNLLKEGVKKVTEKGFIKRLYTHFLPDPDLIIRTSGEKRISNFLLWQSAYSEFAFTDTLWPDLSNEEFKQILEDYSKRERRYGKI